MISILSHYITPFEVQSIVASSVILFVLNLSDNIIGLISNWFILSKAREKGWKGLIPIYGGYMLYKIAWKGKWYWIKVGISTISLLLIIFARGNNISGIAEDITIIIEIIFAYKLSTAFGHGIPYAIGLLLFPEMFKFVLAAGIESYEKDSENKKNSLLNHFSKLTKLCK